jgi:CDP-glucose 4,6-dehydratase
MVAWLKLLGAEICAYGPPPSSRPNFFDATLLDRGMRSTFGDLRDRSALANTFADFQPEIVMHASAQAGTRCRSLEAVEVFSRNIMGSVFVLEEARLTRSVRAVVVEASDACYEHRDWFWGARERDPLGAHDPFSASMAATELFASGFLRWLPGQTTMGLGSARMPEAIGGGDWEAERPVANLVRAITSERPFTAGPAKVAVWHVLEAVRACLLLAKALFESGPDYTGPWNFGPEEADYVPEHELAVQFIELWGAGELLPAPKQPALESEGSVRLNTRKAETELGWSRALRAQEAIEWTAAWYKGFYGDPLSAWRTTEDQLERYMRRTRS